MIDPVPDPGAYLTALRARVLEREGIPMVLALQGAAPRPADAAPEAEGAELADLLRHYRAALAPEADDDAEPALIDVLQVMGAAHLTPRGGDARKEDPR
ncbi:hypothetical protein STTU_0271 [Streptomyces sp. Tu6071]|uniref:hypothetical protein n=1 Tax=Streptomyces sp. Tu6071 TaxID=355249 RepID=UPI00020E51D3|nr:hypothetical protein [Streptomyces sp. Tu6071]EGJ73060.1 hypothetical protein STTU_0271 [Streptomyces sp. Tu6071]